MTSGDQKFFKEARIEPCEVLANWQTWREEEIATLRQENSKLQLSVVNWIIQCREENKRVHFWRLVAFAGWLLALLLLLTPLITR